MATRDDQRKLIKLARRGKLEGDDGFKAKLQELVKSGFTGEDLDYADKPYFRPALWEATWKNHETIIKLLVDQKASIACKDYQSRTPLHEAAYYGHMNLVTFFLEKGHPLDATDVFGQTPLFRAAEAGRDEVAQTLIERKAMTNVLDTHGVTPQHCAAFQGMPDMAWWLYYKGAWKNRYTMQEGAPVPGAADRAPEAEEEDAGATQVFAKTETGPLPAPGPAPAETRAKFSDP